MPDVVITVSPLFTAPIISCIFFLGLCCGMITRKYMTPNTSRTGSMKPPSPPPRPPACHIKNAAEFIWLVLPYPFEPPHHPNLGFDRADFLSRGKNRRERDFSRLPCPPRFSR